jgi:succinate dehydrogenase / fumarate reductase membrane anchor subunit
MPYKHLGSTNSGAPSWLLQRITGLVLIIAMVGHYILMHYTPASGHEFISTFARMQNPWWKVFYLTFVVLGMYHGLNGVWGILRDFKMKRWFSITIFGIIVVAGISFGVFGFMNVLSF